MLKDNNSPIIKNQNKKLSFHIPTPKTKKQWIIAVIIIILVLSASVFSIYWFIFRSAPKQEIQRPVEEQAVVDPGPQPIYSTVSGRAVEASINDRAIYAVQIENSPEARPQSGLYDADIVSEAIAEGGITRFNAIFHDKTPPSIGPVRSLRPYYIDWFLPYDAAIVHAGGSGEALAQVGTLRLKDIDHGNSSGIFERIKSKYAPHNLYTTGEKVTNLMNQRGYASIVKTSLERKEPQPSASPTAKHISLNISRKLYNVDYTYNPESNNYLRNLNGMAQIDAGVDKQITPDVVIVAVMGRQIHADGVHTVYDTIGSGKVTVFQDGTATEGTWTKSSREAQWELKDSTGNIIKLNPGQRWFTMIESADRISYTP